MCPPVCVCVCVRACTYLGMCVYAAELENVSRWMFMFVRTNTVCACVYIWHDWFCFLPSTISRLAQSQMNVSHPGEIRGWGGTGSMRWRSGEGLQGKERAVWGENKGFRSKRNNGLCSGFHVFLSFKLCWLRPATYHLHCAFSGFQSCAYGKSLECLDGKAS